MTSLPVTPSWMEISPCHHRDGPFTTALSRLQEAHAFEISVLQRELDHLRLDGGSRGLVSRQVSATSRSQDSAPSTTSSRVFDEPPPLPGVADVDLDLKLAGQTGSPPGTFDGVLPSFREPGANRSVATVGRCRPKPNELDSTDCVEPTRTAKSASTSTNSSAIHWNFQRQWMDPTDNFAWWWPKCFQRSEEQKKERLAYGLVKTSAFEFLSYSMIILNSIFIGISMNESVRRAAMGDNSDNSLNVAIELTFVIWFTVELVCKFLAEDLLLFLGPDWTWNLLDLFLVVTALCQQALNDDSPSATLPRVVRLLRVSRVLRLVRVVRVCQSLRVMIFGIIKSLNALAWVFVVLMLCMYMFAMIFMFATASKFRDAYNDPSEESKLLLQNLKELFGNLHLALVTLFQAITGGRDWIEVYEPLDSCGFLYGLVFLLYILFMVFLVMNVVIGTVVDVTSGVSRRDRDKVVAEEMGKVREYTEQIREFFIQADTDRSGQLSWEEFRSHMEDDNVKAYFQSLDLDTRQAHTLFTLLDCNDNGEVGISEFLDGCMRLKGQARALDLNLAIYKLEKMVEGNSTLFREVNDLVEKQLEFQEPTRRKNSRGKNRGGSRSKLRASLRGSPPVSSEHEIPPLPASPPTQEEAS